MLKSFFHTGFVVKDLEKSVDFYANVLGMRVAARMERKGEFINQVLAFPDAHIKGAFVDKGEGHQLELIQYINPASGPGGIARNDLGATHLAFYVEDMDKFYEETKERGLRFNTPRHPCPTTTATCNERRCTPRTPTATGWSSWRPSNALDDR